MSLPVPEALTERLREILTAIIEDYIATAEPVGSRTLTKRKKIDLSPATVRNAMADLEELGLLSAPHASAGRVPTPAAFRLYVERLAQRGRITVKERELISALTKGTAGDLRAVLREAGRVLSSVSKQASIVLMPSLDEVIFEHIEFLPVRERSVLAVFVAKSGMVQHRVIELEFAIVREELQRMSNYLASILAGKRLSEVRAEILLALQDERTQADQVMRSALLLCEQTLRDPETPDLVVEGERRFLDQPEFADIEKMRKLLRNFEEKTLILRLLDAAVHPIDAHAAASDGTAVVFGHDSRHSDLEGLAVVSASYTSAQIPGGRVGVVGPTRMDYSRLIPLVELTADTLTRSFADPEDDEPSSDA